MTQILKRTRPAAPRFSKIFAALIALCMVAAALATLWRADSGVAVSKDQLGSTPVTVYRPAAKVFALPGLSWREDTLPVVVISHGFAGSQQLMQAFAVSLARNGYLAVTFDYLGHGRNLEPLGGDVTRVDGATRLLLEQTRSVVDYALGQPDAGGRLAVLGHSMASDVVVRYAQDDPRVEATIAVSLFSPAVTADSPRNLLIINGAFEGYLEREALRVLSLVTDQPELGVTYGNFADGSARRAVAAPWVEHVGVLYSTAAQAEAINWLGAVFDHEGSGYLDHRGPAVLLLLAGLVLLAWPLSKLLPRVAAPPRGLAPRWRELLPAALIPAVLTPLLLVAFPADFLGMLVGGYLGVHFFVYGLLTWLCGLWIVRRRGGGSGAGGEGLTDVLAGKLSGVSVSGQTRVLAGVLATVMVSAYAAGLVGLVMDRWFTSFAVTAPRLPLLGVMLAGTLAYFLADEWLVRGRGAPRGAQWCTRLCFLLSLGIAVALSFEDLFFLLIIAVVIVPYFLFYGLLSTWTYRATGHPVVSAIPVALAFGWALVVVFPLLSGA